MRYRALGKSKCAGSAHIQSERNARPQRSDPQSLSLKYNANLLLRKTLGRGLIAARRNQFLGQFRIYPRLLKYRQSYAI